MIIYTSDSLVFPTIDLKLIAGWVQDDYSFSFLFLLLVSLAKNSNFKQLA